MSTYSETKWVKQVESIESGWQATGRTMTTGNGEVRIEIGKVVSQKTSKKQAVESEDTEAPAE